MPAYVDKKELLFEVLKCKKNMKENKKTAYQSVSPKLSGYFEKMIDKFSYSRQFINIDAFNLDECKQSARLDLYKYWYKFDETKYDNPFSYFTNIIKNGMLKAMKIIKPKEYYRNIPLHRDDNSLIDIHFV